MQVCLYSIVILNKIIQTHNLMVLQYIRVMNNTSTDFVCVLIVITVYRSKNVILFQFKQVYDKQCCFQQGKQSSRALKL